MQYAEDIRKTILKVADEFGPEKSFVPADVARQIDKENWAGLIQQVVFVAEVMSREGQIQLTSWPNGKVRFKKA